MFLSKSQGMFNIFEDKNDLTIKEGNIRFLSKKVQHSQIAGTVEVLK